MTVPAAELTRFNWSGRDPQGLLVTGQSAAADINALKRDLYRQGILLNGAKVVKPKPLAAADVKQLPLFLRQCASLLQAGLPLVQCLDICIDSAARPAFRQLLRDLREQLAGGSSFYEAIVNSQLAQQQQLLNLIRAAEESGTLDICMERLANQAEKNALLEARIKKALSYPTAVLVITAVVTVLMLTRVVPQFATTFATLGAELPWLTQTLLSASDSVRSHLLLIAASPVLVVVTVKLCIKRYQMIRIIRDRLILHLPVMGPLLRDACLARLCRTLSDSLRAGVPLLQALTSATSTTGNHVFEKACQQLIEQIQEGQTLGFAVRTQSWFPVMIAQLVHAGEQSGTLDQMLENCALRYEQSVEQTVDRLGTLIEPVMMAVLGGIIATLMLAMYLPVFRLGAVL
jgi:type IV pilus assembly protein PilC